MPIVILSLLIAVSSPFTVGDKIALSGGGLIAFVEDFGWYQTRLRTLDNELITLPNSALAVEKVVNLSRRTSKKVVTTLRVRYADLPAVDGLIDELRARAHEVPELMPPQLGGQPPEVFLCEFGPSAVEILCKIDVSPAYDDKPIKQRFLLQCAETMARHGVQFQPVHVQAT